MPMSDIVKPSEGVKKKIPTADTTAESVISKRSGSLKNTPDDNKSRGDEGALVPVKPVRKPMTKKLLNDISDKRNKPIINDKTPKKTVQRAKGSMSLNKTIIDKAEEEKKKEGITPKSSTTMKENENVKVKAIRSKVRQPDKARIMPNVRTGPAVKKKTWATVVKKETTALAKVEEPPQNQQLQLVKEVKEVKEVKDTNETTEPKVEEPEENKTGEIQTEGVPFTSCSFFEKIQQGVRAYFAPRNSFTDDKPKKKVIEGIRTGAGVAKGGKEETKARIQQNKKINKIKYSDSDLFYDRQRLKSNSGGQKNIFLNQTPNLLRNLQYITFKKLNHPKKHYVTIQIPRKGYFYRSLELRPNQSARGLDYLRLESASLPTKSEIQIARMASTSSKESNIHKKRIKKSKKKITRGIQMNDKFHSRLKATNLLLNKEMIAQNFETDDNFEAFKSPEEEGRGFLTDEKTEKFNTEKDDIELENLLNLNTDPMNVQNFFIENEALYSLLEDKDPKTEYVSLKNSATNCNLVPSFHTLMSYLQDSFGQAQSYGDLEITPLPTTSFDPVYEPRYHFESVPQPVDTITPFSMKALNIPENNFCVATALCEFTKDERVKPTISEEHCANLIIGDIDLHSEFQNYVKESSSGKNETIKRVQKEEKSCLSKTQVESKSNVKDEIQSQSTSGNNSKENEAVNEIVAVKPEVAPTDIALQLAVDKKPQKDVRGKCVPRVLSLLFKIHRESSQNELDCYEKVTPMKTTADEKKYKKRNSLLYGENSESMPVENQPENNENNKTETNENPNGDETSTKPVPESNQTEIDRTWSPTMEKLGEIFTCIRRQIKKLEKKSKNSNNSWASTIISLLNEKMQHKNQDLDLMNFTKSLKECLKPPPVSGPIADKNQCKKLEAYVNTFQEILMSSLSFEQITYLNKVVSQQEYNTKGEDSDQYSQDETTPEPVQPPLGDEVKAENENSLAAALPEDTTEENVEESQSVEPPSYDATSTKEEEAAEEEEEEENVKKEIFPSTEFQAVLKSSPKTGKKSVDKILVNVKICGSRVLVNDFSYIREEKSLNPRTPKSKNDSELVIENISKKPNNISNNTNQRITQTKRYTKKPTKKSDTIKIVLKSSKTGNQKSTTSKAKMKNILSKLEESSEEEEAEEAKPPKRPKKSKNVGPVKTLFVDYSVPVLDNKKVFEYNQELLKAQHPIDAIIETSESRIIETEKVDDSSKSRTCSKTFRTGLKDTLRETNSGKVFLKFLNCDLTWKNDEFQKSLSAQNFKEPKKNKDSNDVKSLNDLEFKTRSFEKRKKVLGRQHKYFSYPSFIFERTPTFEEKPEDSDWQELIIDDKTDVKWMKSASSRIIKKSDSNVTKKNMKSASVRLVKQESSRDVKRNDLKSGKKKPNRPTFASQAAASERLSRRPARFLKPDPIRPKPKEKITRCAKSVEKVINITTPLENSADSLLFFNARDSPDFWSETSSVNTNTASSYPEEVIRNKQKSQLENSPVVVSNSETVGTIARHKNSPIMIFSTPNHDDDVISQFAIIRSESVLKTLSRTPIPQTLPDPMFKCHSELKFYPGRVADGSDSAEPWVTFVLTPQQQERAKLPSNQVQVVDKFLPEKKEKPNEDVKEELSENKTISLSSIERFIEILKENRLRANRLSTRYQTFRKERKNPSASEIMEKQKLKWSTISKISNTNNRFSSTRFNSEEKFRCEKKLSGSEFVLAKFLLGILQYLLDRRERDGRDFDSSDLEMAGEDYGRWHDIEEATGEMLDAAIKGVTEYEKLVKKTKLLIAIKSELQKRAGNPLSNVRGLLRLSKKLRTLKSLQKLKIEAPKSLRSMSTGTNLQITQSDPVSSTKEVIGLERKSSEYFDAEEIQTGKMENLPEQLQHQSGEPAVTMEPSKGIDGENSKTETALTLSDEALLSEEPITVETEERIFTKMQENLEKNNAAYSVALFDALLSKKLTSAKEKHLGDVLSKVDEKTKKLMMKMEKSAWLKLHNLLEEVLQEYSTEQEETTVVTPSSHFTMKLLNQTVGFLNSIQAMKNKMAAFYTSLNPLSKFSIRRGKLRRNINPTWARLFKDEPFRNNSGYEIHAAKAVHNLCTESAEKETHLQVLKNQIRDQRVFLEYLIKNGSCSRCSEVNDVKNKVSEKIMALVKSMSKMEDVTQAPEEGQKESGATFPLNHVGKFLRYRSSGTAKPADVFGM